MRLANLQINYKNYNTIDFFSYCFERNYSENIKRNEHSKKSRH